MKKFYVLLGSLLMAGGVLAQSPYNTGTVVHKFDGDKHAPGSVTYVDMRDLYEGYFDRATYYSEDFDDGLMGGWTNNIEFGPVGFESTDVGHANDAGSTFVIPALATSTSKVSSSVMSSLLDDSSFSFVSIEGSSSGTSISNSFIT